MGTTTSLNIYTIDIDNSDSISRDYTSLIKMESELLLSFSFIFNVFSNFMAFENNSICLVLNLHLDFLG